MVSRSITKPAEMKLAASADGPPKAAAAGLLRAALLGCAVTCAAALPGPASAQTGSCPGVAALDAPTLPLDVCRETASSEEFHMLSWQLFRHVVWPAKSGSRGEPDTARNIKDLAGPRVFETFKADWEVFRPNAVAPASWDAYSPSPCANQPGVSQGDLVLASTTKFDNLTVGGSAPHVVVAQNRSYVRYQAAYNKALFEGINLKRLYDQNVVGQDMASGAFAEIVKGDQGPMIVKSAWIEVPAPPGVGSDKFIDPAKFYVRQNAWVQIPGTDSCRQANVGLVGLHIVYKTPTRRQWVWASFEHVDNVPEPDAQPGRSYTFYNRDQTQAMTPEPLPEHMLSDRSTNRPPELPQPFQIQRLQQISQSARNMNSQWQTAFGDSVWSKYQLVLTQWPERNLPAGMDVVMTRDVTSPVCVGNNPATANTIMETFLQRCELAPEKREAKWNCMGCHNSARKTDFIWSVQINRHAPPTRNNNNREEVVKNLEDILNNFRASR